MIRIIEDRDPSRREYSLFYANVLSTKIGPMMWINAGLNPQEKGRALARMQKLSPDFGSVCVLDWIGSPGLQNEAATLARIEQAIREEGIRGVVVCVDDDGLHEDFFFRMANASKDQLDLFVLILNGKELRA